MTSPNTHALALLGREQRLSRALSRRSPVRRAAEKKEEGASSRLSGLARGVAAPGGAHGMLDSTVDEMVATALSRGRRTSGVMRALFGLSPSLSGR
jgi:hypothetical protein